MSEPHDLPLTIPVHMIVQGAIDRLREVAGLDRDEAYLLARLNRTDDPEAELLKAIEETSDKPREDTSASTKAES